MRYNIAGLIVQMEPKYERLKGQSEDYVYDGERETNVVITLDDDFIEQHYQKTPEIGYDGVEYLWAGAQYYSALISFYGMMLHSSCVVYNNRAYLFSAPCGTGKSTHTQLWLKRFPGAYILNDDKPALRITDDGIYAFGTPFSGKTDLNVNKGVKVGGICVLSRDTTNHIEKISADEALFNILNQTVRPTGEKEMDKLLIVLDRILREVNVYRLYCNMELEAAEVSYNGMKEGAEE